MIVAGVLGDGEFLGLFLVSYYNEFYCITQRPNIRIMLVAKNVHPNYAVVD